VLLNIIKSMDVGTECPLSNFAGGIRLEGVVDTVEDRTTIQKDHDKLKKVD